MCRAGRKHWKDLQPSESTAFPHAETSIMIVFFNIGLGSISGDFRPCLGQVEVLQLVVWVWFSLWSQRPKWEIVAVPVQTFYDSWST